MKEINNQLKNALESGNCVLFIGAGMGHYYNCPNGGKIPDSKSLALEIGRHFGVKEPSEDLVKMSKVAEIRSSRIGMVDFITKRLSGIEPDECVDWISSIRWRAIYTTNYDNAIQISYDRVEKPKQTYKTISVDNDLLDDYSEAFDVPIVHLHGNLFNGVKNRIIVTDDDYSKFRDKRNMLFETLKLNMAKYTFVYIGYSNTDPNWNMILSEMRIQFDNKDLPIGYKVDPGCNEVDIELMKEKKIEVIDLKFHEFVDKARLTVNESVDILEIANRNVAPDGLEEYKTSNPISLFRALESWTYVKAELSTGHPNIREFYRGDIANWPLISSEIHFKRDVEEDIYNSILDKVTSSDTKPTAIGVFGSAGYGTTTILKSIANTLICDREKMVFYLKDFGHVKEGDIEFLVNNTEETIYFVIDNLVINDRYKEFSKAYRKLKDYNKKAVFLVGARLNEYSQIKPKVNIVPFYIDPLSYPEIDRLLGKLKIVNELGRLKYLDYTEQVNAISINYERELLVAIREATEGKGFESIIKDEYEGINDDIAKQVYLVACCFHQFGFSVRDGLVYNFLDIDYNKIPELLSKHLIGVVVHETLNEEKGYYAVRSRHRSIANIVWKLAVPTHVKDKIILGVIDNINVTIGIDKKAFEIFTKTDEFVDAIGTYEKKVEFFEKARKKDPANQYVRQHYARMLLREGHLNAAKDHILSAIEESNQEAYVQPILYHTCGQIYSKLALTSESARFGRNYMDKAIENFEKSKFKRTSDPYPYQSIANLKIEWSMRKDISEDESLASVEMAEEEIDKGLKIGRDKESFWLLSSRIQDLYGTDEQKVEFLKKAIQENENKRFARKVLAGTYCQKGLFDKAIEILQPLMDDHTDDIRIIVDYVLYNLYRDGNYNRASAILQINRINGMNDPRFVSMFVGVLYLSGDRPAAFKILDEARNLIPITKRIHTVYFKGVVGNNTLDLIRLKGKVAKVDVSYAFIKDNNQNTYFLSATKYGDIVVEEGLDIYFTPGFSAKGSQAVNVSLTR